MKYCTKCEMNLGNIELLENDGKTFCPKCTETEVREITNNKLNETVKEITEAFYNVKLSNVQNSAQELIKNVKTIELGEKKLKKEVMKREKILKELEYELAVIRKISSKLNYKL